MAIRNLGRVVGADGKSAFQIWLEQGNTGSEQDFLDSLKGDTPDLSDYALKSDIPKDYITEIPEEYVTETELNQAITNAIGNVLGGEY